MTDREKFTTLMAEFGVTDLREEKIKNSNDTYLVMEANHTPKVGGYSGFCAWFGFTDQGKFIDIDIIE